MSEVAQGRRAPPGRRCAHMQVLLVQVPPSVVQSVSVLQSTQVLAAGPLGSPQTCAVVPPASAEQSVPAGAAQDVNSARSISSP